MLDSCRPATGRKSKCLSSKRPPGQHYPLSRPTVGHLSSIPGARQIPLSNIQREISDNDTAWHTLLHVHTCMHPRFVIIYPPRLGDGARRRATSRSGRSACNPNNWSGRTVCYSIRLTRQLFWFPETAHPLADF